MRKIVYADFQLNIEKEYDELVARDFQRLYESGAYKELNNQNENKHFNSLLKYAIQIKDHYAIKVIEEKVLSILAVDVRLSVFLYQDAAFNVSCFTRRKSDELVELQIFVSQHFFNNLNEDEQLAIIGHEVAHHLFGHIKYPVKDILKQSIEPQFAGDIKSNLTYWSKASEISADIIGLLCNDLNFKAYSTAIIKHTTGLNEGANSMFSISSLINLVLKQYEQFAQDPYFNDLNSIHPLMHLRVKVINSIARTQLLRHYGEYLPIDLINSYKEEYNDTVNDLVKKVYPEMFPNDFQVDEIIIPMAMAVIFADGIIDEGEVIEIKERISRAKGDFSKYLDLLSADPDTFDELMNQLIAKSIHLAKSKSFDKSTIISILRMLIKVAASDGSIDKTELMAIFKFAKEFEISKQEIVFLIETQYNV